MQSLAENWQVKTGEEIDSKPGSRSEIPQIFPMAGVLPEESVSGVDSPNESLITKKATGILHNEHLPTLSTPGLYPDGW